MGQDKNDDSTKGVMFQRTSTSHRSRNRKPPQQQPNNNSNNAMTTTTNEKVIMIKNHYYDADHGEIQNIPHLEDEDVAPNHHGTSSTTTTNTPAPAPAPEYQHHPNKLPTMKELNSKLGFPVSKSEERFDLSVLVKHLIPPHKLSLQQVKHKEEDKVVWHYESLQQMVSRATK